MEQHDINVDLLLLDLRNHLVDIVVLVQVNGGLQLAFVLANDSGARVASADPSSMNALKHSHGLIRKHLQSIYKSIHKAFAKAFTKHLPKH